MCRLQRLTKDNHGLTFEGVTRLFRENLFLIHPFPALYFLAASLFVPHRQEIKEPERMANIYPPRHSFIACSPCRSLCISSAGLQTNQTGQTNMRSPLRLFCFGCLFVLRSRCAPLPCRSLSPSVCLGPHCLVPHIFSLSFGGSLYISPKREGKIWAQRHYQPRKPSTGLLFGRYATLIIQRDDRRMDSWNVFVIPVVLHLSLPFVVLSSSLCPTLFPAPISAPRGRVKGLFVFGFLLLLAHALWSLFSSLLPGS